MKALATLTLIIALTFLLMNYTNSSPTQQKIESHTITRIWRGWTSKENADKFQKTLTDEAIPSIESNKPKGCLGIQVLRRETNNEVEFTTIMLFNSLSAIKEFAGEDYEAAHIDPKVKPLLIRYDHRVAHHETLFTKIW
jgi:hypothetical protein